MEIKDKDFIYDQLWRWIEREHQFISNRMGWLIGVNAFFFASLAIIKTNNTSNADMGELFIVICTLGALTTILLGFTVWCAISTLNVLHKRRKLFERKYLVEERYKVLIMQDYVQTPEFEYPSRNSYVHKISVLCQILVPVLILLTWISVILILQKYDFFV